MTTIKRMPVSLGLLLALCALAASVAQAGDWPAWRGPNQNGVSDETGLVSSWSPEGENLLWSAPWTGRSTPVVFDGRVCVNGRVGEGIERQEIVGCFDAETGKQLWEHRFNVYNTTVPFNRVGWASPVGDLETGYLYAHGVAGQLYAYDREGKIVWSYFLTEEVGHASGYGGRTQTPLVFGDLLVLSFVSGGWGEQAPPRHRYFAFDKRNGDLIWVATPGNFPYDMNTQSAPVTATIGGRAVLVTGDADGHVYGLDIAAGGEKLWQFQLSKRGLNSTVVVDGETVYASHSEENIDEPTMGRVVAFKGTGSGDITRSNEIWRNPLSAGFPSPALHGGRLYVIDNSANLHALDAATGKTLWQHHVGTVGKASPVWADGKLYVPETNGLFHILKPGKQGCEQLDQDKLTMPDGRYAEIYGSPAIADGRVYFTTEAGVYALGSKDAKPARAKAKPKPDKPRPGGKPAAERVFVAPYDLTLSSGDSVRLRVVALDSAGRLLPVPNVRWSVSGVQGSVDAGGRFSAKAERPQVGKIEVKVGDLTATARVRVYPELPWSFDFEDLAADKHPADWIGAARKFVGGEFEGRKVLVQPSRDRGLQRGFTFFGPQQLSNYTVEVEARGHQQGRRRPDLGVIANGYTLDLQGNHQRVQIRSWASEYRMAQQVDFPWEMDTWYKLKLRVDVKQDKALVRGKVWKAADPEPAAWTLTVEDPLPIESGSPGLIGYAPADVYYDNLKVTVNE